jgi:hypothetical protein
MNHVWTIIKAFGHKVCKLVVFMGPPFPLLLVGTVLSYLFIPWISSRSTHRSLLQEERVKQATEILDQSLLVDKQLNSIRTAFELFEKAAVSEPSQYKMAEAQLNSRFYDLYSEFNRHAWWWDHNLPVEARLLDLPPGSEARIGTLHEEYVTNLMDSTHEVELLRGQFLVQRYKPGDKCNAKVLKDTDKELKNLERARGCIISKLAGLFMPPKITWYTP